MLMQSLKKKKNVIIQYRYKYIDAFIYRYVYIIMTFERLILHIHETTMMMMMIKEYSSLQRRNVWAKNEVGMNAKLYQGEVLSYRMMIIMARNSLN